MSSKPSGKPPATAVTVDDDEDVDDLDDVLEEFSKPSTTKPKPSSSTNPPISSSSALDEHAEPTEAELDAIEADFAAELAAGMEAPMKGQSVPAPDASVKPDPKAEEKQLHEAFAKMLLQEGATGASNPAGSSASSPQPPADFQKTIREAVERLKNSDETLKAESSDPLAQLLASLGDMGDLDGDLDNDGQMQGLLENMMSQLLSKELLYEPMKELDDKFPDYFKEHSSKLNPEDLAKYKKQQALISQTVKLYEDPSYSDDNPEKSGAVMNLMQEIQALGPPPKEIMGELPPGMSMGPDGGLEGMEGCTIA